jgi:uncharacterized membrane protein YfhO
MPGEHQFQPGRPSAEVVICVDAPERVEIEVETERGGLLVLADRFDRGWSVTVDGRPARALRANYVFRGVLVPAGKHRVVWQYRTPGLTLGAAVSLCSLSCLLAIVIGAIVISSARPRLGRS